MPMSTAEKDDLKAKLAAARQKAMNFGLSLAMKAENSAMLIHKTLKPEKLQKDAKKIGGSPKVASGTVVCKGKLVMLTCLEDPPSMAAKKLKAFLKFATGDSMKIQIMDVDGNVLESEDDGEQKEARGAPSAAKSNPPKDKRVKKDKPVKNDTELADKLTVILRKMAPKIKDALTKNPSAKDIIQKLILSVRSAGDKGDEKSAKKRLGQLNELISKVAASSG